MNARWLPPALAVWAVIGATLLATGCQKADEAPDAGREMSTPAAESTTVTPGTESVPASSSELTGIWTVVGHHIPGISAMSDAEAAARHGKSLRLTATQAVSPGNHCDNPSYAARAVARGRFLATEFNLPPGRLPMLDSLERLTLLEVTCNEGRWAALGGLLIEIDAGHALSPWDGVFFELARDHDFRAAGQEPFWRLEIRKGKEIRFVSIGKADVVTPDPGPSTGPESGTRTYHAVTEANDLRVVIRPTQCIDAMSGKPFAAKVTVTLNGQSYQGCGEALP